MNGRADLAFLADGRAGQFRLVSDLDSIAELVEPYGDLPLGTVDASIVTLVHRDLSTVRPPARARPPLLR